MFSRKTKMMKTLKKGFTLIELLVVISIIGIIAAFAIFGMRNAFENTRNTQRKSDLKQYQNSLENFANSHDSLYPIFASATSASDTLCTGLGQTNCPEDPLIDSVSGSPSYRYQSNATGTIYTLWAEIEGSTDHWVVCSTGRSEEWADHPTGGTCPF